jgi:hypothetical protein
MCEQYTYIPFATVIARSHISQTFHKSTFARNHIYRPRPSRSPSERMLSTICRAVPILHIAKVNGTGLLRNSSILNQRRCVMNDKMARDTDTIVLFDVDGTLTKARKV